MNIVVDTRQTVPSSQFLSDVITGLSASPKSLPCKYFYDAPGSRLFEQICETEEYYVTRTEIALLKRVCAEVASIVGPNADVLEPGSGAGIKVRTLLDALQSPRIFAPIDISHSAVHESALALGKDYPDLEVHPVVADFTRPLTLPARVLDRARGKRLLFFPGSTISNFGNDAALALLRNLRSLIEPGEFLFMGVDLIKERHLLERAYDDAAGVTARFNLNLLERICREFSTDLDPATFRHRAWYNDVESRIEMHLESTCNQTVRIESQAFKFTKGESIHTENSYKFSIAGFLALANSAGLAPVRTYTDDAQLFSVHLLQATA